jgi:hypothetical protein
MRDSVFGRRLLILVAVLMGLTALAASLAPPPPRGARTTGSAAPSPAAGIPTQAAGPATVTRTIDGSATGAPVRIDVHRGQMLELSVTVAGADSVALGDVAVDAADAGSPAQFELFADLPAVYPLRLLEAGRQIGVVRVSR